MSALTVCLALLLQAAPARPVSLRGVELDVHLQPATQMLSAKVSLDVVSRRMLSLTQLVLVLPAAFAHRSRIEDVWDETGLLAWHTEPVDQELRLTITLTKPLPPLSRRTIVVRFELTAAGLDSPLLKFTAREVQVASSGWYPWPENLRLDSLREFRFGVRLPRTWRIETAAKLKRIRNGPEFAEYELKAKNLRPGTLLFAASAGVN